MTLSYYHIHLHLSVDQLDGSERGHYGRDLSEPWFLSLCLFVFTASCRTGGRQHAGGHAAADRAGDLREEPGTTAAVSRTSAVQLQHLEQRRLPSPHW